MWLAVEWVGLIVKWVEFDGAVLGLMMHVHMYVVLKTFFAFLNFLRKYM